MVPIILKNNNIGACDGKVNQVFGTPLIFVAVIKHVSNVHSDFCINFSGWPRFVKFESQLSSGYKDICCIHFMGYDRHFSILYSKTCLKLPLKMKTKIVFQDRLSLNAGQKYCRMLQESILQYF